MTWEYDNPTASTKDEVRFLLGDTDQTDPQLQDEEIDYLVAKYVDPTIAAVAGCRALASKFARLVSKSVGDLRIDAQQRSQTYRDLASHLSSAGASTIHPIPHATGITQADKQAAYEDTSRVPSAFAIGQDDFRPGAFTPEDERLDQP